MCLRATPNMKYVSGAICYLYSLDFTVEPITPQNFFSPIASLHQSYSHFLVINLHFGHHFFVRRDRVIKSIPMSCAKLTDEMVC